MFKTAARWTLRAQGFIERLFTRVAERRVPHVVSQRDRLRQIFVQTQRPRNRARNLRDLERMRQPCAKVIAKRLNKNLGLVLQSSKRLAMKNAVAVALKTSANRVLRLRN